METKSVVKVVLITVACVFLIQFVSMIMVSVAERIFGWGKSVALHGYTEKPLLEAPRLD